MTAAAATATATVVVIPADEVTRLRHALAAALHHLEHPEQIIPANRVRQLRALAGVPHVEAGTAHEAAMNESAKAAAKWIPEEVAAVDRAIATVATRAIESWSGCAGSSDALTFTADDVWAELGAGFVRTKGLAAHLTAAANRGLIENTGRTVWSTRDRNAGGRNQRLTVWRALP